MACGACALNGFNDKDGITNTESGTCGDQLYGRDEMFATDMGPRDEPVY